MFMDSGGLYMFMEIRVAYYFVVVPVDYLLVYGQNETKNLCYT